MSIKTKMLLTVICILVFMTMLNLILSSYLTKKQSQEEAYKQLSLQLTVFQKELEQMREEFVETAMQVAGDAKNLGDIGLLYSQFQATEQMTPYNVLTSSLNRLQSVLFSSGMSGIVIYPDNTLSHYVTTRETGMSVFQDGNKVRISTQEKSEEGTFDVRGWRSWTTNTPLPRMIESEIMLVPSPSHQVFFDPAGLILYTEIPIQGNQVESFGTINIEEPKISNPAAFNEQTSQGKDTRIIGGMVFFKVIDAALLQNYADKTGVLPAIYSLDAGQQLQLKDFLGIADTIRDLQVPTQEKDTPTHFSSLSTKAGQPYYQELRLWKIDADTTLVLGAALSQEGTLAKIRETRRWLIITALVVLLGVSIVGYVFIGHFVQPINALSQAAQKLAQGVFDIHVTYTTRDEIGILSQSFYSMVAYLREMADAARKISHGEMRQTISPRSDQDKLGNAFHHMTAYLDEVSAIAASIAEGDLTQEIPLHSESDEFGRAMLTMIQGLTRLIEQIRKSTRDIDATGQMIVSLTEQDRQIVENVQDAVQTMIEIMKIMGESVQDVATNMEALSSSVHQTSASVTQMTASITQIASSTNELSEQTQHASDVLEGTVEKLEGVAEKTDRSKQLSQDTIHDAREGQQAVEQVKTSMDAIQQTNSQAVETITRFEKLSGDIGTILDVIQNVTEQTTLLALNASIIAAQAGAHGRGFAVIADEIKNLADQVSSSTKDIGAIVRTVRQETGNVVQMIRAGATQIEHGVTRTQEAREMLEKIISSAERSSTMVSDIADALHIQRQNGHDIMQIMEHIHALTVEITGATNEEKEGAIQIELATHHISDMAMQTQEATESQLNGVQGVIDATLAVQHFNEQNLESSQRIHFAATEELTKQAALLLEAVERFTLKSQSPAS